MNPSIPASRLVNISPATIGTGGTGLEMSTLLIIDKAAEQPRTIGVREFADDLEVRNFYGSSSAEYDFAQRYFAGYEGATRTPSSLLITEKSDAPVPATLQGASVAGVSIEDIQVSGNFEITIDGSQQSIPVDLEAVTSFTQAATVLGDALTGADVTFYSGSQVFEITSAGGESSSISFATGVVADALKLSESEGAVTQNGQAALSAVEAIDYALTQTRNFAIITYLNELSRDDKEAFASWVSLTDSRFMGVAQDTSTDALTANNSESFGAWLTATEQDGTMAYFGTIDKIAALCGGIAAIDFNRENGRRNIMFMSQAGLVADVTSESDYTALISNGYTFYAAFGTANDRFQFQTNGAVSGQFVWADTYVNQIYLKSQLQLALMTMLTSYGSIPYNTVGQAYHRAAAQDPVDQMINFGAITPLEDINALSNQQKSVINQQAGRDVVPDLINTGYVMVIENASAEVRGNRGSMPFTLWYTDGGSVQSVSLTSVNVQ